jgi:hypothetical protein
MEPDGQCARNRRKGEDPPGGDDDLPARTQRAVDDRLQDRGLKVRGWLGKTKNLDGAQLLKDFRLLRDDRADLLVIALSEVAHLKWRGEGPAHQVKRRVGCADFEKVLADPAALDGTNIATQEIVGFRIETKLDPNEPTVRRQHWRTSTQRVIGSASSNMPRAEHFVTLCWRAAKSRRS